MEEAGLIQQGTKEYKMVNLALFLAGFATFSTLYTFQPLFPELVREFRTTPAVASLSLSVATLALAWTLPASGTLSDALGRRCMMGCALILAPLLAFAVVASDSLQVLLSLRFVQGLVLAGVPAVAMAYLNEEMSLKALGSAMGIYIGGNAFGGMTGRILTALLTDYMSWRSAVGVLGLIGLAAGVVFMLLLPPSRNFKRRNFNLRQLTESLLGHLQNRRLLCLYLVAFTCMGGFVTLYNYVTFRLLGAEFGLSQTQAAAIFLAYAFGAFGSSSMGSLRNRYGQTAILLTCLAIMLTGLMLTMSGHLPVVIVGIIVFTVGFFGAHSVASAWVGCLAKHSRAQASSLYLFAYYLGSSVSGTGGGFFYSQWGWSGVVLLIFLLLFIAGFATLRLTAETQEQLTEKNMLGHTE